MLVATFGAFEITRDLLCVARALDDRSPARRAALRRALQREDAGEQPDPRALREAEEQFRRARRLLAGDDLRAWLDRRDLTVASWRRLLGLLLLTDTRGEPPCDAAAAPAAADHAVADDDRVLADVWWAVDRLDGSLAEALHQHLLGIAAQDEAAGAPSDPDDRQRDRAVALLADPALIFDEPDVERVARAIADVEQARRARAEAIARTRPDDVRAVLDARRLAWTMVRADRYVFGDEAAAREALACLRVDRASQDELERRSGVRPESVEQAGDRLGPAERSLLSASIGDAVGPVVDPAGVAVLVLRERRTPPADELHDHARRIATDDRLERRLAGRVHHHVDL